MIDRYEKNGKRIYKLIKIVQNNYNSISIKQGNKLYKIIYIIVKVYGILKNLY